MIDKSQIEAVKNKIDLKDYIEYRGIELKKNGKGYIGLCPFHNDKNPSLSVTPERQLWQCFGCGEGGDIIKFVELFDKIDFKKAYEKLTGSGPKQSPEALKINSSVKNEKQKPALTAKLQKIFNRVIEFYHTTFTESPEPKDYLLRRGIDNNTLFSDYKTGCSNGTLLNVLPNDGDIIDQLKEIGILNDKGTEFFYGCVTFPLYDPGGNPAGMYGRRINFKGADHLYLSGKRDGLFNWQTVKTHKEIILTESIIDSLTLINAGIKNTVPCYGTNGLTDAHLNLFALHETEKVFICFDSDEAGRKGSESAALKLKSLGIEAGIINLPEEKDINDFFLLTADAKNVFTALIRPDDPAVKKENQEIESTNEYTVTDFGFITTINNHQYEVRGISKQGNKLKAAVKGITGKGIKKRIHADTIDFYSARSRNFYVSGLADLFGEDVRDILPDMDQLLTLCENYQPGTEKETDKKEMTPPEKEKALLFLKNPNMFDEILNDFETIGYTGEEMNKLLCYIAAISRKMDEPLSVMIQSRSAAGKSCLQDAVLSLVPKEDTIKYTRLTDQALFYKGRKSLMHKILAIEELDGMNGAIYSIRSIQSSKEITIAYTGKDNTTGKLNTEENTVEGPLMVFITTTQLEIDGETASRFVFISIDESREMTEKIFEKQRERHTMAGMLARLEQETVVSKHKNANRLLKPLCVLNPYAGFLTFNSKSLRARRDHNKYLNLISAIAYLFQYQRKIHTVEHDEKPVEYINVTLEDIKKANEISDVVLGRSLDELSPPSRKLLILIREMAVCFCKEKKTKPKEYHFTRRDIREFCGWSDFQVKTHIKQLEELEYIYSVTGQKGKQYVYELLVTEELKEDKPFLVGLIDIAELARKAKRAGIGDE